MEGPADAAAAASTAAAAVDPGERASHITGIGWCAAVAARKVGAPPGRLPSGAAAVASAVAATSEAGPWGSCSA